MSETGGPDTTPPTPPQNDPPPPPGGAPPPPGGAAPPPPGATSSDGVSPNRQIFLVLSYLWLLALVPFLIEKEDREVQWHAKHGLVLLVAEVIVWIALNVVQWVAGTIFGPLACFGCVAFAVLAVAQIALHIACIVKALGGERLIIPGVSQYADQF